MRRPDVKGFFDDATNTISYVVADSATGNCAVVDPVLDYDVVSGRTSTGSADQIIAYVHEKGLNNQWVLETHVHADHISSAPYIKQRLGGRIGIGTRISEVQTVFADVFNLPGMSTDGSQFDQLFADGEAFLVGDIEGRVMQTPGHTPACCTYLVGDAAFVGDTMFMPDFGSARCDFPGGDAGVLYDSIQSIFALPDATRLFMCHDYKASGRDEFEWETTVAEQKKLNIHIRDTVCKQEFIKFRTERDTELGMPRLMLPSIQLNICAGQLPPAEDNGTRYLKIPLNAM
jgi:glyoxylase-like metal-dependent hydrolase (beta-lactamase superfamily II)